MEARDGDLEARRAPLAWVPTFPVGIALLVLVLSLFYAVTFSYMVYISLLEQVIRPELHPPRYAPHVHYHNNIEWALLVVPAVAGWLSLIWSVTFLVRRWIRG